MQRGYCVNLDHGIPRGTEPKTSEVYPSASYGAKNRASWEHDYEVTFKQNGELHGPSLICH